MNTGAPAVRNSQALIIHGLTKRYVVSVLDNFDLTVDDGEFVCLLGPNGCGKTTLLRILAGIETPDSGDVLVHGSPLHERNRLTHRIGYVFQEPRLLPWKSVRDNVKLAIKNVCRVDSARSHSLAQEFLRLVGLSGFEDYFPNRLSGGMQQRASIARALAVQPELLLMDEPFSALDPENRRILQDELLRIWRETRVTVLFVTHSVDEAFRLASRVLVLSARPTRILLEIRPDQETDVHATKQRVLEIFAEQVRLQQGLTTQAQAVTL